MFSCISYLVSGLYHHNVLVHFLLVSGLYNHNVFMHFILVSCLYHHNVLIKVFVKARVNSVFLVLSMHTTLTVNDLHNFELTILSVGIYI